MCAVKIHFSEYKKDIKCSIATLKVTLGGRQLKYISKSSIGRNIELYLKHLKMYHSEIVFSAGC